MFPLEPVESALPRRGRAALALQGRHRRDRRHHLRHAAILRRLHARADLGRGEALHLPVRDPRHRPPRAAPRGRDRRGARGGDRRRLGEAHRPLLGAPHRATKSSRGSRCPTSGARRQGTHGSPTSPLSMKKGWRVKLGRGVAGSWWSCGLGVWSWAHLSIASWWEDKAGWEVCSGSASPYWTVRRSWGLGRLPEQRDGWW